MEKEMKRRPAVAGMFYESSVEALRRQLEECFAGVPREETEMKGAVVPHAGYIYSGSVAAAVYARMPPAETFVILGPNHYLAGSAVATSKAKWLTPLGEVPVDEDFVEALRGTIIDTDETAHRQEHSIEVQLPFLQFTFRNFKFVPICMSLHDEDTAKEVGESIAEAVLKVKRRVIVIASSDFTHYEPDSIAREKDKRVIDAICELDVAKFYRAVREVNSTACGVGPVGAMLVAAKMLGATKGLLLKYATSGDITGERSSVVGYGGIAIV
ncbi:MAG: MEMO1 family protein [Candidatus Methanospirare jalkutatii]|nr:MEMO1 family protein [Candidatus Methanospirare jalkutatii]